MNIPKMINKTRIFEHSILEAESIEQLVELATDTLIENKICMSTYKHELLELLDDIGVYSSANGVLSLEVDYSPYILKPNIEVIVTIENGLDVSNLISGHIYLVKVSTGSV